MYQLEDAAEATMVIASWSNILGWWMESDDAQLDHRLEITQEQSNFVKDFFDI